MAWCFYRNRVWTVVNKENDPKFYLEVGFTCFRNKGGGIKPLFQKWVFGLQEQKGWPKVYTEVGLGLWEKEKGWSNFAIDV